MHDPSDHMTALSPAGTMHVLQKNEAKTLCGRDAGLQDGWGWGGAYRGTWDGDFPSPYEHESACVVCAHNYHQR